MQREDVIAEFARLWWAEKPFIPQTWLGVPTWQHPFDAWITQEIICETQPERIVETGTLAGGSATMWASLFDHLGIDGRVVTIDVHDFTQHKAVNVDVFRRRVDFIQGSSTDPAVVAQVRALVDRRRTMVILDSAHHMSHVRREIDCYADLVTVGCYLIVQDGHVNGHPCEPDHGPGPFEAINDFIANDDRFEVDRTRERMLFTFNPSGFLRRVR